MGVVVYLPPPAVITITLLAALLFDGDRSIGWSTTPSYTIPHYPSLKKRL